MESLNNRTYIMPEANIKPFCPAASDVASKRFPHTLSGLGNNKAVTTFIAVICFLMAANINAQTLEWVKSTGGGEDDEGKSITVDATGNVYITGFFKNSVDFDPGPDEKNLHSVGARDIFVQKLDANGNFLWAKSFGGKGEDLGVSIALDEASNVYITGGFDDTVDFDPGIGVTNLTAVGKKDIFIQKLDANGNFLWAKSFGGNSSDQGKCISIDTRGNVYTTGSFIDKVDFDPGTGVAVLSSEGETDVFVQKLDANGNFLWAKSCGGKRGDVVNSIAIDKESNVYTTGTFKSFFNYAADFDPGPDSMKLASAGEQDIFILKLDANGNFLWAKSCGAEYYDNSMSIAVDDKGNVYTTGLFTGIVDFDPGINVMKLSSEANMAGQHDMFILKLDANGNFIWAKSCGGKHSEAGLSIAIDEAGNVFTTGYFGHEVDFDPGTGVTNLSAIRETDIFIQKLDSKGNFLWAKSFGGNASELGNSITVDKKGNVFITGYFSDEIEFELGSSEINISALGKDFYILKLK
ncbi:MAG: SBBP repeat-containing protein [Ignavibacteria bacterium]|jgi:hypothetical protein|nr:SBBP repeat-containing protein [Ignavibacteria bacterium]